MANVPAGIILIWPGTHATIPTGWTRETTLDDKYPKGHGIEDPNITGGSNTHSHSDGGHEHSLVAHSHSYSTGNSGTFGDGSYSGTNGGDISGDHNHSSTSSNTTSGGNLSDATTWASANHEPPYHKVIFIKPSGASAPMRQKIVSYYKGSTVPSGFFYCDGNNSTPDFKGKYLKGAATEDDAGGTGGSTSHQHDITHNHTPVNHSHTGPVSSFSGSTRQSGNNDVGNFISTGHSHTAILNNTANTVNDYGKTDAGASDTVEPAHVKVGAIQCNIPSLKVGMIGIWLKSIASVPSGWKVCDGDNDTLDLRDKFIKISNDLSENGNTGGSNTHSHTGVAHNHTSTGSHSHTGSTSSNSGDKGRNPTNNGSLFAWPGHTHALNSVSSVTATYNEATTTPQLADNQPAYRTVAYIQLIRIASAGAALLSLLN